MTSAVVNVPTIPSDAMGTTARRKRRHPMARGVEDTSVLTEVLLPLGLAVIMGTLGLTLVVADFKRVVISPRGVAIGMLNLLVIAPLLAFAVALPVFLVSELIVCSARDDSAAELGDRPLVQQSAGGTRTEDVARLSVDLGIGHAGGAESARFLQSAFVHV